LPLSTEAHRCSEFAQSLRLRPAGTGLFLDRVVLISTPGPWPKPALKHPGLHVAAGHFQHSAIRTRPFASEPSAETDAGSIQIEVFERAGAAALHLVWTVNSVEELDELAQQIANTALGALTEVSPAPTCPTSVPTFLVCVQGSHDICCGISGVALADQLDEQRPGYRIRRVSHTGGHRFAPTLIAFPEGRMWAYADIDLVDRIANDIATADDHRTKARGWWGAGVGAHQVAECAVRARGADRPFVEPAIEQAEAETAPVRVAAGDQTFLVEVEVARHVPTITCEAVGGLPAKPSREFSWTLTQE